MTIYGLDFSHYDAVPAGARVVSEGFSFMTHKAGGDANDAELAAWWKALKPYRDKVLLGAYWVLYPGNPTGRADAFLARLDSQCPGWRDGPFIMQLDCEEWNEDPKTKPGKADIKAACDRLKAKMPKLTPIVYASAGQYDNDLTGLGYPLWNARYPTGAVTTASGLYALVGGDSGKGWAAYSGQTPAIWQFTATSTALGQTTCDANAYRGTLAQLTALLAPGWDDDVTPAELLSFDPGDKTGIPNPFSDKATNPTVSVLTALYNAMLAQRTLTESVQPTLAALSKAVNELAGKDVVDEGAIVAGVLAGLDPAAIAAAIPADVAEQVADILAQRLSA